jgi:hypothetical protein
VNAARRAARVLSGRWRCHRESVAQAQPSLYADGFWMLAVMFIAVPLAR